MEKHVSFPSTRSEPRSSSHTTRDNLSELRTAINLMWKRKIPVHMIGGVIKARLKTPKWNFLPAPPSAEQVRTMVNLVLLSSVKIFIS